jgi:hypothetical protein
MMEYVEYCDEKTISMLADVPREYLIDMAMHALRDNHGWDDTGNFRYTGTRYHLDPVAYTYSTDKTDKTDGTWSAVVYTYAGSFKEWRRGHDFGSEYEAQKWVECMMFLKLMDEWAKEKGVTV